MLADKNYLYKFWSTRRFYQKQKVEPNFGGQKLYL